MEAFNDIHFKFIHAQSCSYHFPFILIGPFSSHVPHHSMDWLPWFSHVFSWNIGDLEFQFPQNQWFKEKSTGNHWFSHVFLLKLWLVYSFTSPCFPPKPSIFPWNMGGSCKIPLNLSNHPWFPAQWHHSLHSAAPTLGATAWQRTRHSFEAHRWSWPDDASRLGFRWNCGGFTEVSRLAGW